MNLLLTGAAGFIGRATARALARRAEVASVRLLDRQAPVAPDARFEAVAADLTDPAAVAAALQGVDAVIHLASVPGGAAEADPARSRAINLDATLRLLESLDARDRPSRFVYASSIAVFGRLAEPVDDATPASPLSVYGAHKRMVELALADFHRRGRVGGVALRLPGIVARPPGAEGLKSAFMSEVFHAAARREPFVMPVGPEATLWLMSAERVAENLVHAALLPTVDGGAFNLPVIRTSVLNLVSNLYADPGLVRYAPDMALQAAFGAYPPLSADAARALGFDDDGSLEGVIAAARV